MSSLESAEHIRIAEQLGYERALCYDSPAFYPDVWMTLMRAAETTERIVLGTGVLIPSLRHPMVTASAITTLVDAVGEDRVMVGIGSGFTGRASMGQKSLAWTYVKHYTETLQALLRGEQVEWEGAVIQMLHPDERFGPKAPISVSWGVAGEGPKGTQVAREVGAELFRISAPEPGFDAQMMMNLGTVLDEGEDPGSQRAIDAGGQAAGVWVHWAVEHDGVGQLDEHGQAWAAAFEQIPENVRHLALYENHAIAPGSVDRRFINGDVMRTSGVARTAKEWRERWDEFEEAGCTYVHVQPAGPDIVRELEAFAAAFHG